MNVALYFGSFNPVHNGHLIIAQHILNETDQEQVWLIVSPQNPFKKEKELLNEYNRLHLAKIAIEGSDNLKAVDFEFKLPRPSYTIHTLTFLKEKYGKHKFSIVMGSDSLQNLSKWKNADQIMKNYEIIVFERPGIPIINPGVINLKIAKAPLLEISSTHIRKLIQKKASIRFLVPDIVREEIIRCGYYKLKNPAKE